VHPQEELLAAFASGDADLPRRVVLEGHFEACAECRATLAELSTPGGVLLQALAGDPPPPALWDRIQARIGKPATRAHRGDVDGEGLPLPPAVRRELADERMLPLSWRRLGRGVRYAPLAVDPVTRASLLVVRSQPGCWLPEHVHEAEEELFVAAGGFTDTQGRHKAGGFASYPAGSIHHPLTDADGECWCLVRLEKPNRLLGWRGWLQRLHSA
jgi:putative transcriptional regulator